MCYLQTMSSWSNPRRKIMWVGRTRRFCAFLLFHPLSSITTLSSCYQPAPAFAYGSRPPFLLPRAKQFWSPPPEQDTAWVKATMVDSPREDIFKRRMRFAGAREVGRVELQLLNCRKKRDQGTGSINLGKKLSRQMRRRMQLGFLARS